MNSIQGIILPFAAIAGIGLTAVSSAGELHGPGVVLRRHLALEEPIQKGRDALGSGWQYPWYDAQTDDIRRIKVRQTWQFPEFGGLGGGGFDFNWLEWLMWIAIAALLSVLAYFLIRAYLKRENQRSTRAARAAGVEAIDDAERIAALPFQLERRQRNLLEEAQWHYDAGRFSQAIIYLFSHELVELDRRQFVRLAKGKTNRQYMRELAPAAQLRRLMEQTMVAFEDAFFGNRALERAQFEACWNRLTEFDRLTAGVAQ